MKMLVDTNILFTFFWKESATRKLLLNKNLSLFSPEFSLEEINKYESQICKRAGISKEEFKSLKMDLAIAIEFIPLSSYSDILKRALTISPDANDVDFIALALKLNVPLWSNDFALKKQNNVKVFSTQDLLRNEEFLESF